MDPDNGPDAAVEDEPSTAPILSVRDLTKSFSWRRPDGRRMVRAAVKGVSFDVRPGETFCLVGESGCGKSTTGRSIMQLVQPDSGSVSYHGRELVGMRGKQLRDTRRRMQMVFQDPYSSLNPRRRIGAILEEAIAIHERIPATERTDRVVETLGRVGFGEEYYYRFPHEMSGGQRQRIGVARALMVDPDLIICDEPVSALDVSIQSQVLNLLRDLQRGLGLSYLFISHDMSVVRHVADRVAVMTDGEIVEQGTNDEVFGDPRHPYTKKLLNAVPAAHPRIARERRAARRQGVTP